MGQSEGIAFKAVACGRRKERRGERLQKKKKKKGWEQWFDCELTLPGLVPLLVSPNTMTARHKGLAS
jgi:hypothetical protein